MEKPSSQCPSIPLCPDVSMRAEGGRGWSIPAAEHDSNTAKPLLLPNRNTRGQQVLVCVICSLSGVHSSVKASFHQEELIWAQGIWKPVQAPQVLSYLVYIFARSWKLLTISWTVLLSPNLWTQNHYLDNVILKASGSSRTQTILAFKLAVCCIVRSQ